MNETTQQVIDAGDAVLHKPSGETWEVACVDGTDLYWSGWPPGYARLEDCELVRKATAEERDAVLRLWAQKQPKGDHGGPAYDRRHSYAKARLEREH